MQYLKVKTYAIKLKTIVYLSITDEQVFALFNNKVVSRVKKKIMLIQNGRIF